jgi:hypothetical protein
MNGGSHKEAMDLVENLIASRIWAGLTSGRTLSSIPSSPIPLQQILTAAEAKWIADAPLRREEALKNRMDKVAPLWELEDPKGNKVKLEDLKAR